MVNFMKKLLLVILVFLFISLINKDEVKLVFNEQEESYNIYEINFKNNINTKDLSIFDNITVISITPKIDEKYKDKFSIVYTFEPNLKLETNVNRFINSYINKMNELNYKNEAISAKINGVNIESIVIYTSLDQIKNLQSVFSFEYQAMY